MATSDELLAQMLRHWRPPARMTLSQHADEFAFLSAESSAEAGKWRTLPYQRGVMDAFTDPTVETVVWMKSARVGATKIFNHLISYHIHQDPCPIMVVQPTVEDAEGYSKDEIAPMIRDTPILRGIVSDPKAKDGSNTILTKQFPGGTLGMVGANSARGFRRVSRRVVLFDEVDGYPASTPEGDQIKLGIKRSEYYWNRKIGIASTPTIKGLSRVERWFLRTDQRRYFVPCPECDHRQVLRWGQIKWKDNDPETAAYECEGCGVLIPHSRKRWMVERGEWRLTAKAEVPGLVGFHIWAGYSFSPNATWAQLVREFLEVKGNPDQLRTFVNTTLGETFEQNFASKLSPEGLSSRAEEYDPGTCPDGVMMLTAGVDVQDNRLAVSVWGWGVGEEGWLVWHQELMGDPSQDEVWGQLDQVLDTEWHREDDATLMIRQMAIDAGGHRTHDVYNYARERARRGVVVVKGWNARGKPAVGRTTPVDVNQNGKLIRRGVLLSMVGSDTIKTTLFGRLRHVEKGPGCLHFGMAADEEYFRQLTAEKQVIRYSKGFPVEDWVKKDGDRNEALDCLVYAYAALQLVYRKHNRATIWERLAAELSGKTTPRLTRPPVDAGVVEAERPQPERRRRERSSFWGDARGRSSQYR